MMDRAMLRLLPLLCIVALACSRAEDTGFAPAPCTLAPAPSALFELQQVQEDTGWELHASAAVFDGPYPHWQTTLLDSEHCRYGYYVPSTCSPECEGDAFCVDGDCIGWPDGIAAGDITVEGLGEPLVMSESETRPGHYHASVARGFEAFGEGSPLRFSAVGDVFPAVELGARGVSQVETPASIRGLRWTHGQEVTLAWEAGSDPAACVSIELYTMAYGHGTPLANLLECVVPDSGSYAFPVELVDLFPEWDTPGVCVGNDCPYSEIRRFTRHIVSTDAGDAWLSAWTSARFPLEAGD
jgi:hypothetical protein